MNFTPIDGKGLVEGFCIIKTVDRKTSAKGDEYLDFTLEDKTGKINAKLWAYNEILHGTFSANDLVKVRGTVSVYQNNDQLRIEKIRKVTAEDNIRIEDFVSSAKYDALDMYRELYSIAEGFEDSELKLLVTTVLSDNKAALLYWPAAFRLHHAIRGGLLMHTLSVVRICESYAEIYTFIDRELLLSGAILHDIAKTVEFTVAETGLASGYSVRGNLIGHLNEGAMIISNTAKRLGISDETAMLIEHMLLSHHGEPEFGSAVRPMFIEAQLLSEADNTDAEVYAMREALLQTQEKDFSGKLWSLDNRKLYNHARKDLNKETKLF